MQVIGIIWPFSMSPFYFKFSSIALVANEDKFYNYTILDSIFLRLFGLFLPRKFNTTELLDFLHVSYLLQCLETCILEETKLDCENPHFHWDFYF